MASLHSASRVREVWTGTTTSSITLSGTAVSGPPGGYRTFATAAANGLEFRVLIEHQTATEWMIARFGYNSGTGVLTYVSLEASSTGSQVTFSAGTKHIAIITGATDALSPEFYGNALVRGSLAVGGDTASAQIGIYEPSGGGSSQTGFKAPALAADVIYTLPTADGSAGQTLITDGSKALSWASRRELLTANRTYYVRTDGSNSNTGLANTAGGAFLTIQKAIDVASGNLDISIYDVTISVADGTYTGAVVLKSCSGTGAVYITGNTGTPGNVVISTTSAHAIACQSLKTTYTLDGMKLQTTTSGYGINANGSPTQLYIARVHFGTCAGGLHMACTVGATIYLNNNYTITNGSGYHWYCGQGGAINAVASITITLSGTPAFSSQFAFCGTLSQMYVGGITFSGSATGTRYLVNENGVLRTNSGGASYLPGNAAGSTATGGQYT